VSCPGATYTTATTTGDDLPVTCVSWYLAYAFCAWDGGRLPTEAEWNFAATGGAAQRVYPWSTQATIDITSGLAVYNTTALAPVGSRSPQGDSRHGVSDLAGNASEWVVDAFSDPYPTTSCDDCATLTVTSTRVLRGGGFASSAAAVTASFRTNGNPANGVGSIGLRCARNP
jgi:sulfatase modifying factor 1